MNKATKYETIHAHLHQQCNARGWTLKDFSDPKNEGVPSCVISTTQDCHYYIEIREPGKKATPLQKYELRGVYVFVVNSKKNANIFLDSIQRLTAAQ